MQILASLEPVPEAFALRARCGFGDDLWVTVDEQGWRIASESSGRVEVYPATCLGQNGARDRLLQWSAAKELIGVSRDPSHQAFFIEDELRRLLRRWARHRAPSLTTIEDRCVDQGLEITPLLWSGALLDEPGLQADLVRYPAARVAFCNAETSGRLHVERDRIGSLETARSWIETLRGWRRLFAANGRPSRVLNRTLDELPAKLPVVLFLALPLIPLEREVSLLQLHVLCELVELSRWQTAVVADDLVRIQRASDLDLRAALAEVAAAFGQQESSDVVHAHTLAALLFHCTSSVPASIALRTRVRRALAQLRRPIAARDGGTTRQVVAPPIPLPRDPGVRFLASVDDILTEGARMEHCVGLSVFDALRGRVYLFHLVLDGEHATASVDVNGQVVDIRASKNSLNAACARGRAILEAWGMQLLEPSVERPTADGLRR